MAEAKLARRRPRRRPHPHATVEAHGLVVQVGDHCGSRFDRQRRCARAHLSALAPTAATTLYSERKRRGSLISGKMGAAQEGVSSPVSGLLLLRVRSSARPLRCRFGHAKGARQGKMRKKNLTCGTRTSVKKEMGCNEIYVFIYGVTGPKLSLYVFRSILVSSVKL